MVALLVMRRTKRDKERLYEVLQCCLFVCLCVLCRLTKILIYCFEA
jgi:hypothetical protein